MDNFFHFWLFKSAPKNSYIVNDILTKLIDNCQNLRIISNIKPNVTKKFTWSIALFFKLDFFFAFLFISKLLFFILKIFKYKKYCNKWLKKIRYFLLCYGTGFRAKLAQMHRIQRHQSIFCLTKTLADKSEWIYIV